MSRLTVGTSRIPAKPPRGQPPCTEPYVKGANILKDPGVELQLANFGGGPGGDEIPEGTVQDGLPFQWSDDSAGPPKSNFITGNLQTGFAYRWRVSSANPRSGTYHLRMASDVFGFGSGQYLYLPQLILCDATPGAIGRDWTTALVEPGDFIKLGVWAMTSSTADAPTFLIGGDIFDADWGYLDAAGWVTETLTTSYTLYEYSMFAPAGAHYINVSAWMSKSPSQTTATDIDLDDFVLEVT